MTGITSRQPVRPWRQTLILFAMGMVAMPRPSFALHTCQTTADEASKRCCDVVCDVAGACTAPSNCDALKSCSGGSNHGECCTGASDCPGGTCAAGDGCVICGYDHTTTITGTNGPDLICTGGQGTGVVTKVVLAKGGDDFISPGIVRDSSGSPVNSAPAAPTRVDGAGGDDVIVTGDGDDVVFGGSDDDTIVTCGGRNAVHGGSGEDLVASATFPVCGAPDDSVGSLLCGDNGDDTLIGVGPAQQCLDGGAGTDICTYAFLAGSRTTATAFDIETKRNCEPSTGNTQESCNCEASLPTD